MAVSHVGGEHEDGDGGDREAQNDDEFGEVGLVGIVGMLIVDQEVHVDEEHDHADHHRHDHQGEVEIAHRRYGEIRGISNWESGLGLVGSRSETDREKEERNLVSFRWWFATVSGGNFDVRGGVTVMPS